MNQTDRLIEKLRSLPATVERVDYRRQGYHLDVHVESERVRPLAEQLRKEDFYLLFVSAVHVKPAIEILYQFASYTRPCRIIARTPLAEDGSVPTICDIFDGANWHERETRDMFGVVFTDHPYPQPLLLAEEDADLRPLLKGEREIKDQRLIRPAAAGAEEGK
jgi:NADH-quinone oxidoreductase subunit C